MDRPQAGDQVSNRQLYDALIGIQERIADIREQMAGLPCREHDHALDAYDEKLRDLKADYQKGDAELKAEIQRKQALWTGGGVAGTLAAIAAWLGFRG